MNGAIKNAKRNTFEKLLSDYFEQKERDLEKEDKEFLILLFRTINKDKKLSLMGVSKMKKICNQKGYDNSFFLKKINRFNDFIKTRIKKRKK